MKKLPLPEMLISDYDPASRQIRTPRRSERGILVTTTLGELTEFVRGILVGDPDRIVRAARPLRDASADDVTFLESSRSLDDLLASSAAAVVPAGLELPGKDLIQVPDAFAAFVAIAQLFQQPGEPLPAGISPQASVDPSAQIGAGSSVAPFSFIGAGCIIGERCQIHPGAVIGAGCRLGDDVSIYPHAVLYPGCKLGHRVAIHAHAVVGADGFGYRFQLGRHEKVPQLGSVHIDDDVEIGAGTTVDRGTFGPTRIGKGTKIDNLVMVAHNCQIGRHNIIVSQSGMAGSSGTGDYVIIAGQVGVVDHVFIGDRSVIGGQAAVTKDVPPDSRMLGSPATPEKDQKRILMSLHHLPEFRKELRDLQEKVGKAG